jgi:hypothetical protein
MTLNDFYPSVSVSKAIGIMVILSLLCEKLAQLA